MISLLDEIKKLKKKHNVDLILCEYGSHYEAYPESAEFLLSNYPGEYYKGTRWGVTKIDVHNLNNFLNSINSDDTYLIYRQTDEIQYPQQGQIVSSRRIVREVGDKRCECISCNPKSKPDFLLNENWQYKSNDDFSEIEGSLFFIGKYKAAITGGWFSKFVLDFKDKTRIGHNEALTHTAKNIDNLIPYILEIWQKNDNITFPAIITSMPSSKKTEILYDFSPRDYICENISINYNNLIFVRNGVTRNNDIIPSHRGNRDFDNHKNSLEISEQLRKLNPKSVILFDDVFTTGNTFAACAQKISEETGCNNIFGIFLSKTETSQPVSPKLYIRT